MAIARNRKRRVRGSKLTLSYDDRCEQMLVMPSEACTKAITCGICDARNATPAWLHYAGSVGGALLVNTGSPEAC